MVIQYKKVFNAMMRLCIRDLLPCLLRLLNLSNKSSKNKTATPEAAPAPAKFKLANTGSFWKKLKVPIKSYLEDMLVVGFLFSI